MTDIDIELIVVDMLNYLNPELIGYERIIALEYIKENLFSLYNAGYTEGKETK